MAETSVENSRKLDRILFLLEGEPPDVPGVLTKLERHNTTLYGNNGGNGMVNKVNIMWRVHVWLLCSLSASFGFIAKAFFEKFFK